LNDFLTILFVAKTARDLIVSELVDMTFGVLGLPSPEKGKPSSD